MEVSAKREGSQLELALKGELDHHGAKGLLTCLEQEIQRSLPMVLILDFSGVTFMDSSGIAVALHHVAPQPRKVFEAAGIGRMMTIE